ncbi:MAG: hypothetical protein HC915_14930 [Anaerolineae bacterium]|nr:hypothetical protein [Anaerolineae bacterium]
MPKPLPLGASYAPHETTFCVWAPNAQQVETLLPDREQAMPMQREAEGYFTCAVPGLAPGTRYQFRLDG